MPFDVIDYSLEELSALLPQPEPDTDKYKRGKLTVVAGCAAYPGAAMLSAAAASRAGAGYTQVVCAPQTVLPVQLHMPSLVAVPWDSPAAEHGVRRSQAVVLGPGFDATDELCHAVALAVIGQWAPLNEPLLIDGGALGVVATVEGRRALRQRTAQGGITVMTPHGREAARLALPLGLEVPQDSQDVEGCLYLVKNLALYYSSVVVLKGPLTYISDGQVIIRMAQGTAALAKAGTGDVLAGMIGALLAQGLDPLDAASLGTTWHALAGQQAEQMLTSICVTAEDVVENISSAAWLLVDLTRPEVFAPEKGKGEDPQQENDQEPFESWDIPDVE